MEIQIKKLPKRSLSATGNFSLFKSTALGCGVLNHDLKIKTAVKAGNSSAVILPRAWLNREVRIELVKKTHRAILLDTLDIAREHMALKEITGIYLTGSYARGDEDENSDIDVMIVTKDTDKPAVTEGIYNILIISQELIKQKLSCDLFPIGQMIKEALPLLNEDYLASVNVRVTKANVKWQIETTREKLELIQRIIKKFKNKRYLSDRMAYTLILRIRTLYLLKNLIENKHYSKKEFIKLIEKISKGKKAYERYLAVKNNLEDKNKASTEEVKSLYDYLKNQLDEVKILLKNLK